jgi:hypothetical protein
MIKNCEYAKEVSSLSNECGLKLYLGKIAKSSCDKCIKSGFNDPTINKDAHNKMRATAKKRAADIKYLIIKKQKKANFITAFKLAATTFKNWVMSGFKTTPPNVLKNRVNICVGCEMWNPNGFNNTGRCRYCGCSTWIKMRLRSARCPIGKW